MIHFDAHADTGEDQFGALVGHGTPMRNLINNGFVRGESLSSHMNAFLDRASN